MQQDKMVEIFLFLNKSLSRENTKLNVTLILRTKIIFY